MATADILRVFLVSYFGLAAVIYTTKLMAHKARTGVDAQSFGAPGSAQFFGRVLFELFRWSIFVLCIAALFAPGIEAWLGPIAALQIDALKWAGAALMIAGLALVLYVHGFLGAEWRSGVPRAGPEALITTGPYAILRHPIFLGVHLAQVGLFFAWPNIFTLVCLFVGVAVIQLQARVEEAHMARAFGAPFARYKREVGGFFPRRHTAKRGTIVIAD